MLISSMPMLNDVAATTCSYSIVVVVFDIAIICIQIACEASQTRTFMCMHYKFWHPDA